MVRKTKAGKNNGAHSVRRAVQARAVVSKLVENPSRPVGDILHEIGASKNLETHPAKITTSIEFQELLNEYLPAGEVLEAHKGLLRAARVDHLVFPKDESVISDEEITAMLDQVNCKVRKIAHGEQARHVYFFSPDNRARKDAIDMAYKLRGSYAEDKNNSALLSLVALGAARSAQPDANDQVLLP
jgi:hypothetical protein